MDKNSMKISAFVAFVLTIPAANWLIGNVGTVCVPNGPCLIPVGFGLDAPSGVLMIGLALVLRDIIHEQTGLRGVFLAIAAGGILSALIAPPALVVASVAAFTLSELADTAVYAPLRKRRLWLAVAASGVAGAIIDSAVFLSLAFGSLDYLAGNAWAKTWMSFAAVPVIYAMRKARQ